jgi:hypothetical protein
LIFSNFPKTDEDFPNVFSQTVLEFIPIQFEVLAQFETSKPEKFIFCDILKLRYLHDFFKIVEIVACDPEEMPSATYHKSSNMGYIICKYSPIVGWLFTFDETVQSLLRENCNVTVLIYLLLKFAITTNCSSPIYRQAKITFSVTIIHTANRTSCFSAKSKQQLLLDAAEHEPI